MFDTHVDLSLKRTCFGCTSVPTFPVLPHFLHFLPKIEASVASATVVLELTFVFLGTDIIIPNILAILLV